MIVLFYWAYIKPSITGLPEAQYNVGFCYNSGLGTKKDFTLAAEYYQMASMQKFSLAMVNLELTYKI
jgi:TPR repeat protein